MILSLHRKHTKITSAPLPFELPDGSTSVKDFLMAAASRLNRFTSHKNLVLSNNISLLCILVQVLNSLCGAKK